MKSVNFDSAYLNQKEQTQRRNITAYKVGASNYRSAEFFQYEGILLGGIDIHSIYYNKILKNYSKAEAEIITKISISECGTTFNIVDSFIGIECPFSVLPNPDGSPLICIADNCSAGDLIVFQKLHNLEFEQVSIFVDDELLISGAMSNLKYPITNIVKKAFSIIKEFNLPLSSKEILLATGGITDIFQLNAGAKVEIICE